MTFLLNVMFARYFAAAVSGEIFYLFTIFVFVVQIVGLSLESGIGYFSARSAIADSKIMGIIIGWGGVATLLVTITYLLLRWMSVSMSYPLIYPLFFIIGNLLINYGNAYCLSKYRFMLPNIISVAISCLLILLLFIFSQWSKNPDDFIDFYFFSFLLQGILLYGSILYYNKWQLSFSFSDIGPLAKYSLIAFTANLLTLILNRIDYVFVKTYCSPDELGNYIQVSRIGQLCVMLPSMVSGVLFPYISAGNKNEMKTHVKKISRIFLVLFSTLAVLLGLSGYWLFPFLYGESFDKMYVPFLLMAPGIICLCTLYPYATYHAANNNIRANIIGVMVGIIIVLTGDWLLVPVFGINAAAAVRSVGYIFYQFTIISLFKNEPFRTS